MREMQAFADELSKNYQCIMLEQRGTGRSKLSKYDPSTINLSAYMEDIEALRKHLGADKLILTGNSWGMMLALAHGGSYPNNVKPRRLNWTVPSPPLAMFRFWVPPDCCGRKVVRSLALRMPSFSMSAGRYVSTGLGPVSSAVGMFEPVTMTRSTSAVAPVVACARGGDAIAADTIA